MFMLAPKSTTIFHPMQDAHSVAMHINGNQGKWGGLFADMLDTF